MATDPKDAPSVLERTRQLLKRELPGRDEDIEALAAEIILQKRALEVAAEAARVAEQRAEKSSEVKSSFLNLVSHELRTPLTALHLNLHILADRSGVTEGQRPAVDRLTVAVRQLTNLVDALLEYSRIEAGRIMTDFASVEVLPMARTVAEDHRIQAKQKNLDMQIDPASENVTIVSDARLLRIILNNLIDNAVKYTEEGSIRIIVRNERGGCRLSVKDTGRGISPADRERIFLPFEQLEALRHKGGSGVGLGLALVRQIAHALGGRIELDSKQGQGSTFSAILPPENELPPLKSLTGGGSGS